MMTANFRPAPQWEIDMRIAAFTTLATVARLLGVCVAGVCLLSVCAQAQQPSPAEPSGRPVALPASPPAEYGPPLSNEQAKAAADGAVTEAKKNNWHMAISVVGPEGELIYFEKMDGAQSSAAALAQAKARTSAMFRRPSKVFADQFSAGNVAFMTFPDGVRPVASEGGVPIILNGKLVGAIGVSGGTAPQDSVAATAGVNAVRP
jgi:glc operon protein GlcG